MHFADIPLAAKVGAGAIAALALLGGAVAIGAHLGGGTTSVSASAPAPVTATAQPGQSPAGAAGSAANQAVRRATAQAEAQVLGSTPKQLAADLRSGHTLQQLATARSLSQDQFRTQLVAALKPLLDQEVTAGTLTAAQEQRALQRLATAIPNWTTTPGAGKASPSPTP
jgi:hypothetical protein